MKIQFKDILKLVVSIGLTAWVLLKTSKTIEWNEVRRALRDFEYGWILLSIGLSLISHLLRSFRWQLLLKTRNYSPGISTTFMAVMVCYLANMAFPRLGEFMRGNILKEQKNIPLSFSLGTVITDRLLDMFMLILLAFFLFVKEFNRLETFLSNFVNSKVPIFQSLWPYLLIGAVLGIGLLVFIIQKSKTATNSQSFYAKVGSFIQDLVAGIKAIGGVSNQGALWLSTIGIWALYFLMLYVISFGYGPTADLSLMAGISVLVMGSLGMAAPVNSGIGAYQAFVASILVAFGIVYEDGYIFALISHGSQALSVLVFGFLSLLILNFRKRKYSFDSEQAENIGSGNT